MVSASSGIAKRCVADVGTGGGGVGMGVFVLGAFVVVAFARRGRFGVADSIVECVLDECRREKCKLPLLCECEFAGKVRFFVPLCLG